jgi:iron complex transport system permease protein
MQRVKSNQWYLFLVAGLLLGSIALALCFVASIACGAAEIPLGSIYKAFTAFDGSEEHLIITTVRLPRTLIAMMVGACLAVAGAILQGLTRNPLADLSILGINTGAGLAVVIAVFAFSGLSLSVYAWVAFAGAGASTIAVYLMGSVGRGGMTPLKLTLAGAAIAALLSSLTTVILLLNQRTLDEIRFWLAGSVAGRDLNLFGAVLPYMIVGLALALALGKSLSTLSLGEDVAKGLGQRTAWVKVAAGISVILLAGSSVAIAGPIGFIGLVIPHISRFIVGVDYRWSLPYSAVLGAILLLLADIGARLAVKPQELPVGVMTALVGAPFFIYLARSKVTR